MNKYLKIVVGSLLVAIGGLFLNSCASDSDIPSAADNILPSNQKPEGPTGPESGESDFTRHQ